MKPSFQGLAVLSGCAFFASVAKDVEGLANAVGSYADEMCETPVSTTKTFGAYGFAINSTGTGVPTVVRTLEEFNECTGVDSEAGTTIGMMTVCDATTGESGLNVYTDDTCAEASLVGAALPNCTSYECPSGVCALMFECTDDEPSAISPNTINYVADEYNDANCTDPTGNTEVLTIVGAEPSDCTEGVESIFSSGECLSDGSIIVQSYGPEDDTCSGGVWTESWTSAEVYSSYCIAVQVGELYYDLLSCTTDSGTVSVSAGTPSPVAMTIIGTLGPVAGLTPDLPDSATPAPSSSDRAIEPTMIPTASNGSATPTPSSVDRTIEPTMIPTASNASATPTPSSFDRTIEPTMIPTAPSGSRSIGDTSPPTSAEDTETTGAAVRVGNGISMGTGVTLAVGVLVAGMVRSL